MIKLREITVETTSEFPILTNPVISFYWTSPVTQWVVITAGTWALVSKDIEINKFRFFFPFYISLIVNKPA